MYTRTPPFTAASQDRSGMERIPPFTVRCPACQDGAGKKLLVPPPVTQFPPPKMLHSLQSGSVLVALGAYAMGFVLVGASFQPSINWVPPTAVTRGLIAGKPTTLKE